MRLKMYVSFVMVAVASFFCLDAGSADAQRKSSTELLAARVSGSGDEWLQFRGPNGSGIAEAAALPAEFGRGKNLRWKTAVPFARSSPIVTRDRVFLTGSEGEKLITISLDRRTGKVLWQREVTPPRHMMIYRANDPASPSPTSDGKNVYVFFGELGLVSYGPDGTERWRLPLGPFNSFYGWVARPYWRVTCS